MRRKIHYELYQIWQSLWREYYRYARVPSKKEHPYTVWKRLRPYWTRIGLFKDGIVS
jgi:hypothetical protein